ncbi:MAG: DUF3179 domain-containing (seleno)protein, partial [Pseudomonadota bacterium]
RETHSLWNQFTGEPVIGPLAASGIALKQRPVAIATWEDWRRRNPGTRVLSLSTGHRRDYGSGVVYREYFASRELMFPALVDQRVLSQKDYIFGIRQVGVARAWPLSAFQGGRVINDAIGDLPIVLVGDMAGRTVRAYERGGRRFIPGPSDDVLVEEGRAWRIGEEGLTAPDGATLPRIAGHIAYWFAWNNYLGQRAELYSG